MLLLIICLIVGGLLRKTSGFDKQSPIILNRLIISFFIPVLTLYHIPKIAFELKLVWLSVTPFVIYLCGFLFFKVLGYIYKLERQTEGALIMCSGIGSISFVGFPIFEMLYGEEGLSYGIIMSLSGTFLVFNTIGISTGLYYAQNKESETSFWKKLVTFPPLTAFIIACALNFCDFKYPIFLNNLLKNLAAPFSVIALLSIGMQFELVLKKSFIRNILFGQFYKLLIAPILIYILMWHILDVRDLVGRICVLGAALGSMNAISIVAAQMNLNPKLATVMPVIGIPTSILTTLLIDYLI